MKRYIAVTKEQMAFICEVFEIGQRMVELALQYKRDSKLAKKIRKVALERGGVRMVSECNEIETIFDADGMMTQLMPNGAVIKISKETGDADVYCDGELKLHVDNIRIREITALQEAARKL